MRIGAIIKFSIHALIKNIFRTRRENKQPYQSHVNKNHEKFKQKKNI